MGRDDNNPFNQFCNKRTSPCVSCGERAVGCHSKCKQYLEWKANYRAEVLWENKQRSHVICKYDFDPPKTRGKGNRIR